MNNKTIASMLNEIADILDISGENPFRIRTYRNTAQIISDLSYDVSEIINNGGTLENIVGIGKGIEEKVEEIVKTNRCSILDELHKKIPESLLELLKLENIGPKKIKILHEKLGIDSIDTLYYTAKNGKLRDLEGMGEKTEQKILKSIEYYKQRQGRYKLSDAFDLSEELNTYLKKSKGVKIIEPVGSLRRRQETIGDLDLLAICTKETNIMSKFIEYNEVKEVITHGYTKSIIKLINGIHVDLRVFPPENSGSALYYLTGSKTHRSALLDLAKEKKIKINEYGIFDSNDKKIGGENETDIFEHLGLSFIPPELRENNGEIEAAQKNILPKLVELKDIRGDLQMHTLETDGKNTIEEMQKKAKELNYEYIAITNHSKAVRVARGMDESRLEKHLLEIDKVNMKNNSVHILKGVEVDILEDGSLDLDDSVLKKCDVVLASIHSYFNLSKDLMTKRIIKAFENPYVNILGHPTGRLILEREPYAFDLKEVFKNAKEHNIIMEINAYPDRLDLNDVHAKLAKEMGLKLVISTDAHSASQMDMMKYGIFTARRAWLNADDIINTYPLKKIKEFLKRKI